jgi:hypothetical protein
MAPGKPAWRRQSRAGARKMASMRVRWRDDV